MPPALTKKVERYNGLHGHSPKTPKIDKLQKPYQARHTKIKPTANMVEQQPGNQDETIPPTENTTKINKNNDDDLSPPPTVEHDKAKVTPSCGMGEIPDVGDDYMEFLFSSVGMAAIDIEHAQPKSQIPASCVDYLTPTANMASTRPLTSRTSTNGESDERFSHYILNDYKQITKNIQADWGANIIIFIYRKLFTEFVACEASLNQVDEIPIQKIKGYGTVIFFIGNRLVPVQEVAYMP